MENNCTQVVNENLNHEFHQGLGLLFAFYKFISLKLFVFQLTSSIKLKENLLHIMYHSWLKIHKST